jgi:energy-converting hydrogenase Eha subunit A
MNWAAWAARLFQAVPVIVAGIETLHKDKSGAEKKQMAMDALGVASGVAGAVAPQYQEAISAATQGATCAIDAVVAGFNASKHPAFVGGNTQQ